MKRYLTALALLAVLSPTLAQAQCNGVFPAKTICGNNGSSGNLPGPVSNSVLTGVPGGTNGQTQYNNSGVFGGYTFSGDLTVNTATGAATLATSGVSAGTYGSATQSPQVTVDAKGRVTAASNVTIASGIQSTSSVTGTAATYTSAQSYVLVERSNSGSAMNDTLPGTSPGILPAKTVITVTNADTAGLLSISSGSGATLNGAANLYNGFLFLGPGQSAQFYSDGSNYWIISAPARARLAANTTINFSTSGNDATGNGTTAPFATPPGAWNFARATIDHNGFVLTYLGATGNYPGTYSISGQQVGSCGAACDVFQGNTGTPSNVTIGAATTSVQWTFDGVQATVQGFEFNPVTGQSLLATDGAIVAFQNNITQASSGASITAANNGVINITGNTQIGSSSSSNQSVAWNANQGGEIHIAASGITVTVAGNPAWATAGMFAQWGGRIFFDFVPTFSGSASGVRCSSSQNGVINTAGNLTAFPGNSACTSATGGQNG